MLLNSKKQNIKANYEDYLPLWAKVSFNQLALYGTHIGHSVKNLTPYSAWMVLGSRQGLCLINMFKFVYMFRGGLFVIQALIRRRSPIWFVNLDQASQNIVKSAAKECGEYWVNQSWVNGLLTNFHRITRAARNIMQMPHIMWANRQRRLIQNFRHWSMSRYTWPRAVFVSNVTLSYNVCQEAMHLRIPTIGIVDTDSPQKYVNIAVPGNDESFSSVGFYNNLISMFILYNKFNVINLWYVNKLSAIKSHLNTGVKNTISNIKNYQNAGDTKMRVNMNEFNFTSPVSNIKYGGLYHYQDIWKTKNIQFTYDLLKSNKYLSKNLPFEINKFYNENQGPFYALKKIYTQHKKWAHIFKLNRKNRRSKVKIGSKKKIKLAKNAWFFLKRGKIKNSRILRNQTFNFWKFVVDFANPNTSQNLTQIYKRYFKKVYWFPKSKFYNRAKFNIYTLLSTWFFVQFSCKRTLFSIFFHNSNKLPLTASIKQRRAEFKKLQSLGLRNLKRSRYMNQYSSNDFSYYENDEEGNNNVEHIENGYVWENSSKNEWYLRVMGLKYSTRKNVFLTHKTFKPLYIGKLHRNNYDINTYASNLAQFSGDSYCIKVVYQEWLNTTGNNNLNSNYYYNNNSHLFKPLSPELYLDTFSNARPYYIE